MNREDLRVGELYLICGFQDPEAQTPSVEALEYAGMNCSTNPNLRRYGDYFVFLDADEKGRHRTESFLRDFGLESLSTPVSPQQSETIVPEGSLDEICDLDGLIEFFLSFRETKNTQAPSASN